ARRTSMRRRCRTATTRGRPSSPGSAALNEAVNDRRGRRPARFSSTLFPIRTPSSWAYAHIWGVRRSEARPPGRLPRRAGRSGRSAPGIVRAEAPHVPFQVEAAVAAAAVRLVLQRLDDLRAGSHGGGVVPVGVRDDDVDRARRAATVAWRLHEPPPRV